jgi:hypothetical protein
MLEQFFKLNFMSIDRIHDQVLRAERRVRTPARSIDAASSIIHPRLPSPNNFGGLFQVLSSTQGNLPMTAVLYPDGKEDSDIHVGC